MEQTQTAVKVRLATPSDAPELARMRYEFRASLGDVTEDEATFLSGCEAWMNSRLNTGGSWRCWVVAGDGALLGHLWLQLIEKIPNPVPELESHAYITNVFVRPEARGGLGGRLLDAAMTFCREAGVDSVILWPTQRSRSLYKRHGFAARDDIMEATPDQGRRV